MFPNVTKTFSFNIAGSASFVVLVNARQAAESGEPACTGSCTYTVTVDTNLGPPTALTRVAQSSATRTQKGVLLRLRTASEANELGFNVYREVARKRVKINRSLLPSVFGGTARSHAYSFLDRAAPRVGSVRYWVQDVSLAGVRSWSGPIAVS
jgi:hypothetical protein